MKPLVLEEPIMECRNDKCHRIGLDGICRTSQEHWINMITFGKCDRCNLGIIDWDQVDHDYQALKDKDAVEHPQN